MSKLFLHARKLLELLHPIRSYYPVKHARGLRSRSDELIDAMKADINGCSDAWFLKVRDPLDDCVPSDKNRKTVDK